jgi:hypothetical protein
VPAAFAAGCGLTRARADSSFGRRSFDNVE